jgi:hypothetical protein
LSEIKCEKEGSYDFFANLGVAYKFASLIEVYDKDDTLICKKEWGWV